MATPSPISTKASYSPFYLQAMKELWVLVGGFLFFLVWSSTACYMLGYQPPEKVAVEITMGIPSWVFWGIALPWGCASLFTIWYALLFIKDDEEQFLKEKMVIVESKSEGDFND